MTEAAFFSWIRSHIRRLSLKWRPRSEFLKEQRRESQSDNKRVKWEYQCEECKDWFKLKDIEVDHKIECGSIRSFTDIGGFYERMLCEKDGFRCLCRGCHLKKGIVYMKTKSARTLYPREERVWQGMKQRCYNSNAKEYKWYGGRGIQMSKEWFEDFYSFYNDMGPRPEGTSIDRIDVNGDYCKDNCRWATPIQQARNTTTNNIIVYNNEIKCLEEWAEILNIKSNTLNYRLRRGWSIEEAFEIVERKKPIYNGRLTIEDITEIVIKRNEGMTTVELGKEYEIDSSQISRVYNKYKDCLELFMSEEYQNE